MKQLHLATIIEALERRAQRATYASVGGLVGLPAQSVMHGQARTQRNSWVVSAKRKLPTGYSRTEMHPLLLSRPQVIGSTAELAAWLRTHP
jgi:hypothetical protein